MPCLNHLTTLIMPATRSAPMGLSEAEMCAEHSRECINLLFIKCGVTWDWRLNGDLCVIQPTPWSSHMARLGPAYGHCWTHESASSTCTVGLANQRPSPWQWNAKQGFLVPVISKISTKQQGDLIVSSFQWEKKKHKHQHWLLSFKRAEFWIWGSQKQNNIHVKSCRVMFQMPAPTPLWLFWSFRELPLHLSLTFLCAPLPMSPCWGAVTLADVYLRGIFEGDVFRHRNH